LSQLDDKGSSNRDKNEDCEDKPEERQSHRLVGRLQGGFTTCLVLRVGRDGLCSIANAGHLAPFLNGTEIALDGSLPLGLIEEAEYHEDSFVLHESDRLTIYTDGLLEARNAKGELYGFERVCTLVGTRPTAEAMACVACAFGQDDDITVLTIDRLTVNQPDRAATVVLTS
jgi:serine phosphatase RsbU (regulator of sigma subunit)